MHGLLLQCISVLVIIGKAPPPVVRHCDFYDTLAHARFLRSCYAWHDRRLVGLRTCTIVDWSWYVWFTFSTIFRGSGWGSAEFVGHKFRPKFPEVRHFPEVEFSGVITGTFPEFGYRQGVTKNTLFIWIESLESGS